MTLLIHPGFHKTATSWLQDVVFAESRLFRSLLTHHEIDDLLVRPHDFEFEPSVAKKKIAAKRLSGEAGTVDVISSEILSGTIFSGSRESLRLAQRLGQVFDEAKILLTVRSQLSIMKSIYLQYVKRGGRLSIEDFLDYRPEPGYFWFERRVLEFDRLAQAYADRFGVQNVLVLPQELLKRDQTQYLDLLFRFAGVPDDKMPEQFTFAAERGVSPPVSGSWLLRIANAFRRSPLNPEAMSTLGFLGGPIHRLAYRWTLGNKAATQRMDHAIRIRLAGHYGESNRRLQAFTPVDLGSMGYEITA